MKHYFRDPATLSDDELKCLSDELYDAYCYNTGEWSDWRDDEAEARYEALTRELRVRRETRMSPEERKRNKLFLSAVTRASLDAIRVNFVFAKCLKSPKVS